MALLAAVSMLFAKAQDVSTIRNTADVYARDFSHTGSAKTQAMVGAIGALGGDVSVINTNPAGIGVSIVNDVSATFSATTFKNSTDYNSATVSYKHSKGDIGNAGAIVTLRPSGDTAWKFVNVGVNYSSENLDDYSETAGNSALTSTYASGDKLTFLRHAYDRSGTQSKMSIGLAANYNNKVYPGIALHFHNSSLTQYDSAQYSVTNATNNITGYETAYKQFTPFSEDGSGFSASVGIIGKVSNQVRLGVSVETPTWWKIDRGFTEYTNATTQTYGEDRTLSTPLKGTVSAAFVPNKNFAINVDYTVGLSKPKYKVQGEAEKDLNTFFDAHSENESEVKVGAEYRISAFRLRAGYAFANNPFGNVTMEGGTAASLSTSDLFIGKRQNLAAGIGYDFKSFYIDAAYRRTTAEYDSPFLYGSKDLGTGYYSDNFILPDSKFELANVKNTKDNFSLTLGWKF